jgi:hypothetical protein
MNESDAKAALIAMGISPTRGLIDGWLRAEAAEQAVHQESSHPAAPLLPRPSNAPDNALSVGPPAIGETAAASQPAPSSRSRLEAILREQGALVEPQKRRKPGRPRIVASWFPKVADTMKDGTSLEMALAINGINSLSKNEIRACYRNATLKALYQEARRRYLIENYGRGKPTLRAILGRYV